MNKLWQQRLALSWLLGMMFASSFPALAATQESELKKIGKEIHSTQARLHKNQKEQDKLASDLEKAEKSLSQIESEKNTLTKAIAAQKQELDALHEEEQKLLAAKTEQEKSIGAQVNASYRLGHEKNVKVILNQQDSNSLSRSLVYSDYITRARLAALHEFEATLASIDANKQAIASKTAELLANQDAMAEQEGKVKASYAKRNSALQQLQASIKSDESKISQLKNNQTKLQELLRQIRARQLAAEKAAAKARQEQARRAQQEEKALQAQQPAGTVTPQRPKKTVAPLNLPGDHLPFAQARGKLRWPVKGRMDNRFGRPRQPGDFRWEGAAFIASLGSDVQAVHSGRVVFADWFRGKGLLLIIDHGNGYMTLYAHNQTLLKKTGELIKAGDVIATLGNSGGLATPELYFELRHQGEPVNPGNWLSRNG